MYCVSNTYAGDIVVTTTGGVDEIIGNAIALTGAATGAPEASAAANSVTNTITTNITTITSNAWLVDVVGSSLNGSFTPNVSQTEQSDQQTGTGGGRGGGTGASSTKLIATPTVNTPMIQTHNDADATNDLVHAIAAVAPTTTIAIESTSNGFITTNNNTTFTWTHNFNDSNVDNKLIVGVVVEDRTNACTTGTTLSGQSVEVSSITHDGNNLTRIAYQTIRIAIGGQDRCLRAELWYIDIDAPPAPLAEWRMDEGSWSGTAGEVTDITGNGYDGTARNGAVTDNTTPAIATDPGTCGYGEFDDADGSNGDYIELASFPDQTTDFTITAWIRTSDNTRAGQRIFADDENNTGGYALSVGDPGAGRLRFYSRGAALEIIDTPTGGAIANNTWYFVAGVADITGSQIRTYIYDTSGTLVDSASGAITGAWTTDTGVASIAGETNSGETDNRFFGNVDEVHFYTDVLSVSELAAVIKETHPCPAVGDITVNFSANINSIMAGSVSLTNASLGEPESSGNTTSTTGTTIGPTALTSTLNAWLVDGVVSETAGSFSFAGQTERWEETIGGAVAAMSTKEDVAAGANSMSQTHTVGGTNRKGHVAVSVAPFDTSTNIVFDSVASTTGTGNSIAWSHSLTTTNTSNTKLLVTIAFEEGGTCNDNIDSVTYGNLALTQVVQAQIAGGGSCKQVEIWYVDLNNIIVSTDNNSNLGGQAMDQDEAVEFDVIANTGTLFFDDATFSANERLTGLHLYTNGNVALATASDANIGGNAFQDDDIVEVTPSGTAGVYDFVQVLFDGATHFAAANERIDAVYVRNNGNAVLSTQGNANLPGIGNFDDDDIVEWDGASATLVFNIASITGAANNWDVDGVHFLNDDPNLILFSLYNDRTIGPTTYENGDVLLYDRNTSTLSIYFSEDNFVGNEDVDALTLSVTVVADQVDHYAITFPNGAIGVTCEASQITITAHDTGDNPVNVSGGTVLTINAYIDGTTTNTGTLDNATGGGTLGGNPGNPVTYTWPNGTEESSVTLELRQLTPETIDIDLLDDNGDAEKGDGDNSDAEDPEIEYRDAVFRVVDAAASPVSVSTKLSGKPSDTVGISFQDLYLQAIETVSATECTGTFESQNDVIVELASECNNPTSCETVQVQIDDDSGTPVSIPDNANGSVISYSPTAGAGSVQLDFDADSKTPLRFVYNDAGQITLHARYDIDSPNMVYMTGASNAFIFKPAGLCVENIPADTVAAACTPAIATCSPFRDAGVSFDLIVRGVIWESDADTDFCNAANVTTPNFEVTGIQLNSSVVAPAGPEDGNLSLTSIDIVDADKGTDTHAQSIDEVGIFTITASGNAAVPATPVTYLTETIAASSSINIGRFTPYVFDVTSNTPIIDSACGTSFGYIGQPFTYSTAPTLTVVPHARGVAPPVLGPVIENYTGTFFKLTPASLTIPGGTTKGYSALTGSLDLGLVPTKPTVVDNGDGTATLLFSDGGGIAFNRAAPVDNFDAEIGLQINVIDTDTRFNGDGDGISVNPEVITPATAGNGITFNSSKDQRWGRLVLDNAFGSELLPLEIPIRTEYQSSGNFIINSDDGCTTYTSANVSFSNHSGITAGANLTATGAGTLINGVDDDANPLVLSNTLLEVGFVDVTHTIDTWLQYDWDNDTNHDNDPTSRATWGIFAGPEEFIYIREPW